jgi:sugar (pentulose or hexulose) kinase
MGVIRSHFSAGVAGDVTHSYTANLLLFAALYYAGISTVERDGFLALGARAAEPLFPHTVYTSGGGSRNDMWSRMRERRLREVFSGDVAVRRAVNVEASYGAAVLAAANLASCQ